MALSYPSLEKFKSIGSLATLAAAHTTQKALDNDIISISLRQALRLRAIYNQIQFKKLQGRASAYSSSTVNPTEWIFDIPISTITATSYRMNAEATQFPVDSGAITSDHIILKPLRVTMVFEVSNWEASTAVFAINALQKMWAERKPVDLVTKFQVIKNMVMLDLEADTKAPFMGVIQAKATFQQIGQGILEVVESDLIDYTLPDGSGQPNEPMSAVPNSSQKITPVKRSFGLDLLDYSGITEKAKDTGSAVRNFLFGSE